MYTKSLFYSYYLVSCVESDPSCMNKCQPHGFFLLHSFSDLQKSVCFLQFPRVMVRLFFFFSSFLLLETTTLCFMFVDVGYICPYVHELYICLFSSCVILSVWVIDPAKRWWSIETFGMLTPQKMTRMAKMASSLLWRTACCACFLMCALIISQCFCHPHTFSIWISAACCVFHTLVCFCLPFLCCVWWFFL